MSIAFRAAAYHQPPHSLTNEMLSRQFPEWTDDKIFKKTGIRSRFIVQDGVTALDLAETACRKLFTEKNVDAAQIDYLIFCTQSPDYNLPPNSTLLQHRLNLSTALGCFDFTHGCSGYVYGLSLATAIAAARMAKNILLVTAETYSIHLDPQDKATRAIFGDGASATLLQVQEGPPAISHCIFETDGSGAEHLIVPHGNAREKIKKAALPSSEALSAPTRSTLYMNGPAIFSYTLQAVPALLQRLLREAEISLEDVDCFIFHQANAYMLEHLRVKCNIPKDKFLVDLETSGNTVSSSIPIALVKALDSGKVYPGQLLMLAGFGVGLSSAACLLRI